MCSEMPWTALVVSLGFAAATIDGASAFRCAEPQAIEYSLTDHDIAVVVEKSTSGWIELEEVGQNVVVSGAATDIKIPVPPRFGWHIFPRDRGLELSMRRAEPSLARGSVRLKVHCGGSTRELINWFSDASKLASLSGEAALSALPMARNLVRSAPDARARALSLHLEAQALMEGGQSGAASDYFAEAERAWRDVGDQDRALAARVGRVEDLRRAGKLAAVLSLVAPPRAGIDDGSYYAIRLINSRCLTLRDIGRDAEAEKCYEWTMPRLDDLDERIEFVNTLQNYAVLQMERGRAAKAEEFARKALPLATGPNAAIVRGRIHLLLMRLALSRGDPVQAIIEDNAALDAFALARNPRWEANALLELAAVYRELGAYDEAYDAIHAALSRLSPKDAPARIASALVGLAAIDRLNDRSAEAVRWLDAARQIHGALGMKSDASFDAVALARLRMDSDPAYVPDMIEDAGKGRDADDPQSSLLAAEGWLRRGDLADAKRRLDRTVAQRLSLSDRVRITQLLADYWSAKGDRDRAEQVRWTGANNVAALASGLRSRVLQSLVARQWDALRTDAFRDLLERRAVRAMPDLVEDEADVSRVWRWLMLPATAAIGGAAEPTAEAWAFDGAVANELLVSNTEPSRRVQAHVNAQRELLALLSRTQAVAQKRRTAVMPGLSDVQAALDPEALLVAHVDGGARGALLLVSRNAVRLGSAPSSRDLRSAGAALQALSGSRSSPVAMIDASADELSAALFQSIAPGPAPSRLLVLAGSALDGLPWPLLRWPGQSQPMVETSDMSLVRLADADGTTTGRRVHIVVASQQGSERTNLTPLEAADVEVDAIRSRLAPLGMVVDEGAGKSRERVLDAMNDAGAWVHIAAHGTADPRRIGYAGFWLDPPSAGGDPIFLSWLDVLSRGVKSRLVVLDACQLGKGGSGPDGSFGFASAVSEAGARQVVASLWAVSDAASTAWTRAFYSSVAANPNYDAVEALRVAQRELRRSRMFRHPFYWAGWRSFSRFAVTGADASAAAGR